MSEIPPVQESTEQNIREEKKQGLEVEVVKATASKLESEKLAFQAEVINLKAQLAEKAATTTPAQILASQAVASGDETFTADTFKALNDPDTFASSLKYLGYQSIDYERYRLDIRATVKAKNMDVLPGALSNFIKTYMSNEMKKGPLLPAGARPATPGYRPVSAIPATGTVIPSIRKAIEAQSTKVYR